MLNYQKVQRIFQLDIVKIRNKIGTWNMHILYIVGKLASEVKEMEKLRIDIMGISETKWANNILCHYRTTFYYLDTDEFNVNNRHRVGFLIKDSLKKYVKNVIVYSKRIIIFQCWSTDKHKSDPSLCLQQINGIATLPNSMNECAMH